MPDRLVRRRLYSTGPAVIEPPVKTAGTVPSYGRGSGRTVSRDASMVINDTGEFRCAPIPFGRVRYTPPLVHFELANNAIYLWLVYLLADGEIDDVVAVYFEGQDVTSGASWITLYEKLGTTSQTEITEIPDTNWSSKHPGHALLALKVNLLSAEFAGGQPEVEVVIKGRKLYDPRTSTTAWSENPVLVVYDLLTNEEYGLGVSSSLIDSDSFEAAADICDDTMPDAVLRYRCALLVTERSDVQSVIDDLLMHTCGGRCQFVDGKWRLTLDHAHAVGQTNNDTWAGLSTYTKRAQQFVCPEGTGKVKIELKLKNDSTAVDYTIGIQEVQSGPPGTDPSGTDLVTATMSIPAGTNRVVFDMTGYTLTPGTTYFVVLPSLANVSIGTNTATDRYSGGDRWYLSGGTWTEVTGDDHWFLIHYCVGAINDAEAVTVSQVPILGSALGRSSLRASRSRDESPNVVIGAYLDTSDWKTKEVRAESTAVQAGTEQPRELRRNSMPVPSSGQAYRLAEQWRTQAARTLRVGCTIPQHGIAWMAGDVIEVTSAIGPLSARWMRINSITDGDGVFELELLDYDPSDISDDEYTAETVTLPTTDDVVHHVTYEDDFTEGGTTTGTVGQLGWNVTGTGVSYDTEVDHPGIVKLDAGSGATLQIDLNNAQCKFAEKSVWSVKWIIKRGNLSNDPSECYVQDVFKFSIQLSSGVYMLEVDDVDTGGRPGTSDWITIEAWCDGGTTAYWQATIGTTTYSGSKSVSSTTINKYLIGYTPYGGIRLDYARLSLGAER